MTGVKRLKTALSLALAAGLLAAPGAAADPIFGFNDTAQTFTTRAAAVKHAGASIARIPVSWEVVEPHPGSFEWSWLDAAVEALRRRGIRPLFVLSAAPGWAAPECNRWLTATCAVGAGYEGAFVNVAVKLLQRYRGSQVQAWNEPNIAAFGAIPPERIAELTNLLHQAAPRKVIGPVASPGDGNYLGYTKVAYGLINRKVPMALNLYPRSIFRARRLDQDWRRARAIAGKRQIWVTEIGFSTLEFGERGQARRAARAFRFLDRHGARAVIFHCLQDTPHPESEWLSTLGLLRPDGRRKPAYQALRRAVKN